MCTEPGDVYIPLAAQGNLDPIALVIRLLLHLSAERDRTHDAVAKLLVQHSLVSISIVLHDLVQPVHQWLPRRHLHLPPTIREGSELGLEQLRLGDIEDLAQVLDILLACLGLAVEQRGAGDFVTAESLGDSLEGQVLLLLRGEQERGRGRKAWDDRLLLRLSWRMHRRRGHDLTSSVAIG